MMALAVVLLIVGLIAVGFTIAVMPKDDKPHKHHGIKPREASVATEFNVSPPLSRMGMTTSDTKPAKKDPVSAPMSFSGTDCAVYLRNALSRETAFLLGCGVDKTFVERGLRRVLNPMDELWEKPTHVCVPECGPDSHIATPKDELIQ